MLRTEDVLTLTERLENIKSLAEFGRYNELVQDLQKIRERVKDDVFRVAVVGEFSSGKSTFINALLGKDLLFHSVSESTAAVTRICHVPRNHPSLGKCEIEYRNGTSIIDDLQSIAKYTTVQSARNVAEEIRSVSVYTHFMDTDQPITISDTPGLNGLADKHREITLEEVKSAHACIYLLPLRGVTASDEGFLRTLQNYQSCFLFVQNFKDQIHCHEEESVEKLLETDREAVESIFSPADGRWSCSYCAVSALQALASRDRNIQRLYSGDESNLTDADRRQLAEKSGFADFERLLTELIASGSYRTVILKSALQAMYAQIDQLLPELDAQNEKQQKLRSGDAIYGRVEDIQKIIERIRKQQGNNEKKLSNFILSRDKENRAGLSRYAEEKLQDFDRQIEEDIDRLIPRYDDLEAFPSRHGNENPAQYYTRRINEQINGTLLPDIDQRAAENLRHLYEEVLQRASHYSGQIIVERNGFSFEVVDMPQSNIAIEEVDHETEQRKRKIQILALEEEARELTASIQNDRESLNAVEDDAESNRRREEDAKKKHKAKMTELGSRPEVEITQEKRVEHRKGMFKKLREHLFGPESVYYVEVSDDSRLQEWQRRVQECTDKLDREISDCKRKERELNAKQRELEASIERAESRRSIDKQKAEELLEAVRQEEEIYQDSIRKHKNEYCNVLKKRLKESICSQLLDRDVPDSSLKQICVRIDKISEHSRDGIIDYATDAFRRMSNQRIEELRLIQQGDTAQLNARYAVYGEDLKKLKAIKKEIEEGERT